MGGAEVGLQDEGIFADVVSKPRRVNLPQGLASCKVGAIYNNTLIMAVAKLFLHTENRKMKGSIRSPPP